MIVALKYIGFLLLVGFAAWIAFYHAACRLLLLVPSEPAQVCTGLLAGILAGVFTANAYVWRNQVCAKCEKDSCPGGRDR